MEIHLFIFNFEEVLNKFKKNYKFIVLFFIPFLVIEIGVRSWDYVQKSFYRGAARSVEAKKVDAIFVGSSRVAASIDAKYFTKISKFNNVLNLGQGFSTIHEHYLGLRNLFAAYPNKMKGVTIFLEAPASLPDWRTWDDEWFFIEQPQFLISTITLRDLLSYLSSNNPWEHKFRIFMAKFLRFSDLFTYRNRIRDGIISQLRKRFLSVMSGNGPKKHENVDLKDDGGVRVDKKGVELVRQHAISDMKLELKNQMPIPDWGEYGFLEYGTTSSQPNGANNPI